MAVLRTRHGEEMHGDDVKSTTGTSPRETRFAVGVVLRRTKGATRWARWNWSVAALLPGAPDPGPEGRVLAENAETGLLEIHAATTPLELHRAEVEAYRVSLAMTPPSLFVVLRPGENADIDAPPVVHLITASAYEAQDYGDGDEETVEAVPAPEALIGWIDGFVEAPWKDEVFYKRKRDRYAPEKQDGKRDARVRQTADVYRAPAALKPNRSERDE